MASSVVMQSILASSKTPAINGTRLNLIPGNYAFAPSMSRGAYSLQIRCMAKVVLHAFNR